MVYFLHPFVKYLGKVPERVINMDDYFHRTYYKSKMRSR